MARTLTGDDFARVANLVAVCAKPLSADGRIVRSVTVHQDNVPVLLAALIMARETVRQQEASEAHLAERGRYWQSWFWRSS